MTLWSAYGGNSAFGVDNVPHGASQALMPDGNHVLAGLRALLSVEGESCAEYASHERFID